MDPKPIYITVCGNEIISLKSKEPIINLLPEPIDGEFKFDVKSMFENSDPQCPIKLFSLKSTSGASITDKDAIKIIKLNGTTLTIQKSEKIKIDFNIVAASSGGVKAAKLFKLEILKPINNGPLFK